MQVLLSPLRVRLSAAVGWRWPWPALLAWGLGWLLALGLAARGAGALASLCAGALPGAVLALAPRSAWRRLWLAAGFPASVALLALAGKLPAWAWLAPPLLLLGLYPPRAWRDAPWFPTARLALAGLPAVVRLPARAVVLEAGAGLGHGLRALHGLWPQARLRGVEWSRPLAWYCRWRCPFADVHAGDMWQQDWSSVDLVYLFQRPESMPRAMAKARREMKPGSWLVSLEFAVDGSEPVARLQEAGQREVWVYRIGPPGQAQLPGRHADNASSGVAAGSCPGTRPIL